MAAPGSMAWVFGGDGAGEIIRVTITPIAADNQEYSFEVLGCDGVVYIVTYTSGVGATQESVARGIAAAFVTLMVAHPSCGLVINVVQVGSLWVIVITAVVPGSYFGITAMSVSAGFIEIVWEYNTPIPTPSVLVAEDAIELYTGGMTVFPTRHDGTWWYDMPVELGDVRLVFEMAYLEIVGGWTVSVKSESGERLMGGQRILNGCPLFSGYDLGYTGLVVCVAVSGDTDVHPGLSDLGSGCRCELIYFEA